tara:strand:+ start:7179 stop:7520 length:342 start_codon:yes stop_codon:yes gene_type:complete
MKKLFLIVLVCYLHNAEAQNYSNNYGNYDNSFWFEQPQQPILNYQFNNIYNNGGNCNRYNSNIAAREFGRSIGNLIISIQNNKRRKRNRRARSNYYYNNRNNNNCNNRPRCCN